MSNPQNPSTAKASTPPGQDPSKGRPKRSKLDDDVLHVPKGLPRWQSLSLIGLMIFLLVIWLVPNAINGITGKGATSQNPVIVRWERPGHGTVEWTASEALAAERALIEAQPFDMFLGGGLGIDPRQTKTDALVRVLVLDQLAQDAGIEVSDADLAAHLREMFDIKSRFFGQGQPYTAADFKAEVRMSNLDQTLVEESIRRMLRVERFLQMIGFAGAVADPKKIETQWRDENTEFAFDYVALAAADLKEEAQKELPDEAGLKVWFDALSEQEKEEYKTAEKRKGELAIFRDLAKTPAAELLAKYPEKPAEGAQPTAPDELAQQYYNRVFSRRFAKPTPEGADPKATPPGFLGFDEVKERCLAEAPIYFALQRWIDDLNARKTNGEAIDFAAEAKTYGLDMQAIPEPLTRDAFLALPDVGDRQLADALFFSAPDGSFDTSPVALTQGLFVVRATERSEPLMPEFAEIRAKVADKWLEPKMVELAEARLAKLRDGFEEFPPEKKADEQEPAPTPKEVHRRAKADAFKTAVQAAGLTPKTRDYLNRSGPADKDPLASDEEHKTLFSQARGFGLYDLETDEVAKPGVSFDKKSVFLARLAGKRDVPLENMSPSQYERYKKSARQAVMADVAKAMDVDYLKKNYGLWLKEEADAQAKGAGKAGAPASGRAPTDDEDG